MERLKVLRLHVRSNRTFMELKFRNQLSESN